MISNLKDVNAQKLTIVATMATKVMDEMNKLTDNDVISVPTSSEGKARHKKLTETIIANEMRSKFNV